jgi:hypothetical protein
MRPTVFRFTAVLAVASLAAFAADSYVGTWKLNVSKSKYNPGPPSKSGELHNETWGADGVKVTVDTVDGEGAKLHWTYSAKFDGKDYPVTGRPDIDTMMLKRIDASTVEATAKKGGAVVQTVRSTVSADGKTRTSTVKGKNQRGQTVDHTLVYDRVK